MNEPTEPASHEHSGPSTVPHQQTQGESRKLKRTQFYGFSEAEISPTSSLASSNSSKSKKRKSKKTAPKTTSTTGESVVELIQNAEQNRIPSPPRQDIQIGHVSHPDLCIRYHDYEQKGEMLVWDAKNKI